MLEVSAKARTALDAICDTFVPGGEGMLMAVGASPSAAERAQFAGLLDTWDESFPSLSQADREAVLLGWADSPEVGPRAAFQALRKGILLSYYCLPHVGAGPNPVDEALGYPGPLGPPADPPPK